MTEETKINDTRKAELLSTTVEHIDITKFDARPIVDAMGKMSFTSRDLARATGIFNQMLGDKDCSIFVVIAGVWAAFLVQHWIRRREHIATARSVRRNRRIAEQTRQAAVLGTLRGIHGQVVETLGKALPAVTGEIGPRHLRPAMPFGQCLVLATLQRAARHRDDAHVGGQTAITMQVVQRRQQLVQGQVTTTAKYQHVAGKGQGRSPQEITQSRHKRWPAHTLGAAAGALAAAM